MDLQKGVKLTSFDITGFALFASHYLEIPTWRDLMRGIINTKCGHKDYSPLSGSLQWLLKVQRFTKPSTVDSTETQDSSIVHTRMIGYSSTVWANWHFCNVLCLSKPLSLPRHQGSICIDTLTKLNVQGCAKPSEVKIFLERSIPWRKKRKP